MNKFIKIKTIVGIIVALLIGLLNLLDIFSVKANPTDYINTYQIAEGASHWMFNSVSNYIVWSVIKVIICFVYIGLSVLALIKRPKILIRLLMVFEIIVLIWTIRYFILYYLSGFDHYPGFDPYIF